MKAEAKMLVAILAVFAVAFAGFGATLGNTDGATAITPATVTDADITLGDGSEIDTYQTVIKTDFIGLPDIENIVYRGEFNTTYAQQTGVFYYPEMIKNLSVIIDGYQGKVQNVKAEAVDNGALSDEETLIKYKYDDHIVFEKAVMISFEVLDSNSNPTAVQNQWTDLVVMKHKLSELFTLPGYTYANYKWNPLDPVAVRGADAVADDPDTEENEAQDAVEEVLGIDVYDKLLKTIGLEGLTIADVEEDYMDTGLFLFGEDGKVASAANIGQSNAGTYTFKIELKNTYDSQGRPATGDEAWTVTLGEKEFDLRDYFAPTDVLTWTIDKADIYELYKAGIFAIFNVKASGDIPAYYEAEVFDYTGESQSPKNPVYYQITFDVSPAVATQPIDATKIPRIKISNDAPQTDVGTYYLSVDASKCANYKGTINVNTINVDDLYWKINGILIPTWMLQLIVDKTTIDGPMSADDFEGQIHFWNLRALTDPLEMKYAFAASAEEFLNALYDYPEEYFEFYMSYIEQFMKENGDNDDLFYDTKVVAPTQERLRETSAVLVDQPTHELYDLNEDGWTLFVDGATAAWAERYSGLRNIDGSYYKISVQDADGNFILLHGEPTGKQTNSDLNFMTLEFAKGYVGTLQAWFTVEIAEGAELSDKNFDYEMTSANTVTIVGYHGNGEDVVIPSKFSGFKVTAIADNAFKNNETIKNVVIGKNVKTIGTKAFANCTALEEVTFGKSVQIISYYAFNGCTALEEVEFNDALKVIRKAAFSKCDSLEAIVFNAGIETIEGQAFYGFTFEDLDGKKLTNTAKDLAGKAFAGANKALKQVLLDE